MSKFLPRLFSTDSVARSLRFLLSLAYRTAKVIFNTFKFRRKYFTCCRSSRQSQFQHSSHHTKIKTKSNYSVFVFIVIASFTSSFFWLIGIIVVITLKHSQSDNEWKRGSRVLTTVWLGLPCRPIGWAY